MSTDKIQALVQALGTVLRAHGDCSNSEKSEALQTLLAEVQEKGHQGANKRTSSELTATSQAKKIKTLQSSGERVGKKGTASNSAKTAIVTSKTKIPTTMTRPRAADIDHIPISDEEHQKLFGLLQASMLGNNDTKADKASKLPFIPLLE